ncbi:hypothetical protein GYMLUDRAFT_46619 [Collybiopsis luxurians FD-317 M1]|uniref:Uncharacterized protein n=1 Tax=Collybiopsis luxurians FD-317 M1 TaxID=944289 RepID=A0A0D0BPN6_9AGAR|nr:hypothetical protein GYMLUDRAFT_46619 [Collybiopsis luxurians FD-317 M1]
MISRFTALRDKYEHVMAQQQGYQQDLETANSKIKKLQEEIDLLLESLMPTTPPAPSATLDRPERDNYHNRPHGMDIDSEPPRESVPIPIQLVPRDHTIHHDNPRSRPQPNGKPNGSTVNGTRPYSVEPESDHNPSYLSREGNGRIPIS